MAGPVIGSLEELAGTGLASVPTLRGWLRELPEDTPWIIRRGSKGDAYEIDLEEAAAAFRAREEAKAEAARQRAGTLNQLALDIGLGGTNAEAAAISIAERKQLLEEELVAMKIAEKRGELVHRATVETALGEILVGFRQRGVTFAARLAKRVDLTRDHISAIERLVESDQAELARWMENLGKELGDASDTGAAVEDTAL